MKFANHCKTIPYFIIYLMLLPLVTASVRKIFSLFPGCHLKFLFNGTELLAGRVNFLISISSLETAQNTISSYAFTITPFHFNNHTTNSSATQSVTHRFTQCFLHVYMEDELTFQAASSFSVLRKRMWFASPQSLVECPHHYIFFGAFEMNPKFAVITNIYFCRQVLPYTFVRGLVLVVIHDDSFTEIRTHLVCLICTETLQEIKVTSNLPETTHLAPNSRILQRPIVIIEPYHVRSLVTRACDFVNSKFRISFFHMHSSLCLYQIITSSFNVTLVEDSGNFDLTAPDKIFMYASGGMRLNTISFQKFVKWGMRPIPFNFKMLPLKFTAFQPRPSFSAAALLKPYDGKVWCAGILCLVSLAVGISINKNSCWKLPDSGFTVIRIS